MKIQRILATIVLSIFLFGHVLALPAIAEDAPVAPSAPAAPEAPKAPEAPSAPSAPEAPKAPETPKPEEKKEEPKQEDKKDNTDKKDNNKKKEEAKASAAPQASVQPSSSPASAAQPTANNSQPNNSTGNKEAQGNNGDTNLTTGNATNGAGVMNSGNINASTQAPSNGAGSVSSGPSVGIVNSGNGTNSDNSGSASVSNTNNTNQANSATVANNLYQSTTTGDNKANDNTGGNVNLTTGDANTTGTIINNLNTNMSGVAVAEFNVEEDQNGVLVLDFAAGCISNCGYGSVNLANVNNGSGSVNTADANIDNATNTFQTNDANVENNLTLKADSGNNDAKDNTNGDVNITTGDANVSANVLTFANNNVAGNVVYTVVNVFGDLVGNIVMPKEYIESAGGCSQCGQGDVLAANTNNGTGSDNTANIDQNSTNNTFQTNDANIENNLIINAQTSNNEVNDNTNGDNNIKTGNTNVDANVLNVANSNISGGVWWLVLVNEAGNWVGKIVGSPDGTNMAGSSGTEFIVDENGEVMAVNSGNGSDSNNTANIAQNNSNTTVQDNKANIVNNVDLSANTGRNEASGNTGGTSSVTTGDANVVANIVNFVNNNITGGGKLFVTVVNVFGSWTGNFITPDATEQQIADANKGQQVAQGEPEETVKEDENVEETQSEDSDGALTTTKKVKRVIRRNSTAQGVVASETSSGTGTGGVLGVTTSTLSQVAGMKIGPNVELPDGAVVGSNKIRINLAWLILALPLIGLLALSRVRIAYYTRRIRNSLKNKRVEGVVLGSIVAVSIFLLNRIS